MNRSLKLLLLVNGIFNAVGAVTLILFPSGMMDIFGIRLTTLQYFICYLLGACSFSLAVLSLYAQKVTDGYSLHIIALTFFLFHLTTAGVGIYSYLQGLSPCVWVNIGIHSAFAVFFWWLGLSGKVNDHTNAIK